jgi:hypothetical protein
MGVDMQARARRLREYLESDCAKWRTDSLEEAGVDLDADPPVVPCRFVTNEWDGSETYVQFGDTVDEMREICSGLGGELPYVASSVLDLDTGNTYTVEYTAKLVPLPWLARWRFRIGAMTEWIENASRYPTRSAARRQLRAFGERGDSYEPIRVEREWVDE